VLVDSCFAGGLVNAPFAYMVMGGRPFRSVAKEFTAAMVANRAIVCMASCVEDAVALENDVDGGVFTNAVMRTVLPANAEPVYAMQALFDVYSELAAHYKAPAQSAILWSNALLKHDSRLL
jgi:hypothetical protein